MTANYHTSNTNGKPQLDYVLYMVAIFLMVFILFGLNSCNMEKYCAKNFAPTVERKDSVAYIEIEKLRDTTIYIPGESYIIFDSIPCDENNKAQLPVKKVKSKNGALTVAVKDGKLIADCKTDSLKAIIVIKDKTISTLKQQEQTKVLTNFVKTKFDKFTNWFFWIVLALIVGFVAAKLLKVYAKINIPFLK